MKSDVAYLAVPVSYVVDELQRPTPKEVRYYTATICAQQAVLYDGWTATVHFNLPQNLPWDVNVGIIYGYAAVNEDFTRPLCTNAEAKNRSCSFKYTKALGSVFHFKIVAGNQAAIQYTFGVEFVAPYSQEVGVAQALPRNTSVPYSSVEETGKYNSVLQPIIRLETPGSVGTLKSVYYQFSVCPPDPRSLIIVGVYGVTTDSAMATLMCNSRVCDSDSPNTVLIDSDVSDSSINLVSGTVSAFMPGGTVFVVITGFGGNGTSSFVLGARIRAPAPP